MIRRLWLAMFLMVFAGAGLGLSEPSLAQTVDLGLIVVKSKQQAEQIRKDLVAGGSFEKLAREQSVGPAAFRGGRLGLIPLTKLRSEYRQALAGLAEGQPSKVVPTEEGYTILIRFGGAQVAAATPAPTAAKPSAQAKTSSPPSKTPVAVSPYLEARREVMAAAETMQAGDLAGAEKHLNKALGENPREDSAVFLREIVSQGLQGHYKKEALKEFGKGFVAVTNLDMENARAAFLSAKLADPRLWQASLMEANLLAGQGYMDKAKKALEDIVAKHPQADRAFLTLGMMDLNAGKLQGAEENLKKALKINPNLAQAAYQLAYVAMAKGDPVETERYLKATLAIDPYLEDAYNDLGLVYMHKGDLDKSEAAFEKALELNASYAAAHVNLGNLYARQKKFNQAADEYKIAIMMQPSLAQAHSNLAAAMYELKDYQGAIKEADKAASLGYKVPLNLLGELQKHRR
ncbi:MAG: tetratricopeptide repeat protein [Deltaproteobacteria bacterium]|nr:tetratricopeptide repeat protein [Deltaproteobacteria bacterium]